jgi:hypothetical protein
MTVRRIGRFSVTYKTGQVFLVDDASDADSDLTIDQAISLGEALLLAAREAARSTRDEPICLCTGGGWRTASDTTRENT